MKRDASWQSGFALLEAIVAIVILASALVPVYGLISTTMSGAFRLGAVNARNEIVLNALEVMKAVNPMERPEGAISLGLYNISWHADPIFPAVDGVNYPRGIGLYRIGLYMTQIQARAPDDRVLAEFSLRQIGYKRVRELNLPFSAPQP